MLLDANGLGWRKGCHFTEGMIIFLSLFLLISSLWLVFLYKFQPFFTSSPIPLYSFLFLFSFISISVPSCYLTYSSSASSFARWSSKGRNLSFTANFSSPPQPIWRKIILVMILKSEETHDPPSPPFPLPFYFLPSDLPSPKHRSHRPSRPSWPSASTITNTRTPLLFGHSTSAEEISGEMIVRKRLRERTRRRKKKNREKMVVMMK